MFARGFDSPAGHTSSTNKKGEKEMTNEQFDNALFHKGQRATLHATVVGVNFEKGTIQLRVAGKAMPMTVRAANVTLED